MDSEFLEGTQEKRMFGIKYGQTKPTIDLISIALVANDGREYYSISKDFNLKEAWNRYDLKVEKMYGDARNIFPDGRKYKEYWIRENVLFPIFVELQAKEAKVPAETIKKYMTGSVIDYPLFNYKYFRKLINKYGKTNKQIAEEIKDFIYNDSFKDNCGNPIIHDNNWLNGNPQFYGIYADYDWVVFCWLFGKMNDLPKGFPKYCNDLKQEMDEKVNTLGHIHFREYSHKQTGSISFNEKLQSIKNRSNYPKQTNEHNALADSRFVRDLHEFLKTL
jgi:hypothetical protein